MQTLVEIGIIYAGSLVISKIKMNITPTCIGALISISNQFTLSPRTHDNGHARNATASNSNASLIHVGRFRASTTNALTFITGPGRGRRSSPN